MAREVVLLAGMQRGILAAKGKKEHTVLEGGPARTLIIDTVVGMMKTARPVGRALLLPASRHKGEHVKTW